MENIWRVSVNQKRKNNSPSCISWTFVLFPSYFQKYESSRRYFLYRGVRNAVYLLEGNPEPLGAELLILLLGEAERWRHQSYWSDLIPQHHHHPGLKKDRENHVSTILEVESGIYSYWGGWEMAPPVLLIRSNTATSSSSRAESRQRKSELSEYLSEICNLFYSPVTAESDYCVISKLAKFVLILTQLLN